MAMLGKPMAVGELGAVVSYSAEVRPLCSSSKLERGCRCSKLRRTDSDRRLECCREEPGFESLLLISLEILEPSMMEGLFDDGREASPLGELIESAFMSGEFFLF